MNMHRGGRLCTRFTKALGVARGNPEHARAWVAGQNYADYFDIDESLKGIISATGTADLAPPSPAAFDYAEFIRPQTILGRLVGLRRAPARVRLIATTAGAVAYWSGEAQPRPISRLALAGETIEPLGVTAILVTTLELLRSSDPSAESTLSRDLAVAGVAAMDLAFIDPANAGVAGVKPASITSAATPIASTGSSLEQIDADLGAMIDALSLAGSDLAFATWVMHPRTATYLARLRGTGGALAFPGMGAKGGTLLGLPAITSAHAPIEAGSPGNGDTAITLLDCSQILVVDDGGGTIEVSKEGAVLMDDEQSSGAASLVSLWTSECAALKTTRYVNWKPCRSGMVQVLSAVAY